LSQDRSRTHALTNAGGIPRRSIVPRASVIRGEKLTGCGSLPLKVGDETGIGCQRLF